jgi:hypothetical protein
MRDERIVATSCIYVESININESRLAFRTSVNPPDVAEGDNLGGEKMYGMKSGDALVQPRGSCRTMAGRALAWANTVQHCVAPFKLLDPSLPGRRTILCFFLVDPTLRIRSTATVPPQPREWRQHMVRGILVQTALKPLDVRNIVASFIGGDTYEESADRRLRLMEERKGAATPTRPSTFYVPSVSFCEH